MASPDQNNSGLRLVHFAEPPPRELADVLRELGAGDHRFSGTSFGRGECSLEQFLTELRDSEEGRHLKPNKVPQSTYWLADENNRVIGIVRLRHRLNDFLRQYGGHVGYYIRPCQRSKGHGKTALRLALDEARRRGITRALLTVNPNNPHSIRVVLSNGGVRDGQGADPVSNEVVDRFWIDL